jgi:hypothetical protein
VPVLDDRSWLLLHEVRLRGVLVVDDESLVGPLLEAGLLAHAARGVRVTPAGREANASWARLAPGSEPEAAMRRAYESFLGLNRELIRICHDWQQQPGDWKVVDRLTRLHERAAPVLTRVSRAHVRFGGYRLRLRTALARVDEGEREWFTSPRCDSYHTVWMQLHEDVLLALGVERSSEAGAMP